MAEVRGEAVIEQANDNSILNTEPAVVRGAVVSLVGAVGTVLVISGAISPEQKQVLEENAGTIAVAAMTILPILLSIWQRFSVYSPRTAARIAVENAVQPAGAAPTLMTPP